MTHARFIHPSYSVNVSCIKFRGSIFHKKETGGGGAKHKKPPEESDISKINFVESLSNNSMLFYQIFHVVVCRYYITTYRFTNITSHITHLAVTGVFLRHTRQYVHNFHFLRAQQNVKLFFSIE